MVMAKDTRSVSLLPHLCGGKKSEGRGVEDLLERPDMLWVFFIASDFMAKLPCYSLSPGLSLLTCKQRKSNLECIQMILSHDSI